MRQTQATKFQQSTPMGTLSNSELNGSVYRKNVRFSTDNWPYLINAERYVEPRLLLITNRKCHTPCHMRLKSYWPWMTLKVT